VTEAADLDAVIRGFSGELSALRPAEGPVVDAHTHLGVDEDGQSLQPEALIQYLDEAAPGARACAFPFHDPDRTPSYRRPNDRVLAWARDSGGRIVPYCRLDPADDPVAEAQRCLGLGARGIKLHPRAQAFGFADGAADAIFAVARDAGVPILVHAGRGMPRMDALATLAARYHEVTLVLAHAAVADQAMFAARLADHPRVLYDTACMSPFDVVELFARVPAERVVFASDVPYGRPVSGLYQALRVAALAGLDERGRALVAGGTMAAAFDGGALPTARAPRIARVRPMSGALLRVGSYLLMGIAAVLSPGVGRFDVARMVPWLAMARAACRDPAPDAAGPALERIDGALRVAEGLVVQSGPEALAAFGLIHGAAVIAATEPLTETSDS
jgi:uncharacterized protein